MVTRDDKARHVTLLAVVSFIRARLENVPNPVSQHALHLRIVSNWADLIPAVRWYYYVRTNPVFASSGRAYTKRLSPKAIRALDAVESSATKIYSKDRY